MNIRLAALCVAALVLSAPAGAATGLRVTFSAPTHTPKAGAKWFYIVRATRGRSPVRATITTQIVDPLGGVHAVELGDTHRLVTNYPFNGVFRDFVRIPPEAQGVRLTLRVTVKTAAARRVLNFWVRAR